MGSLSAGFYALTTVIHSLRCLIQSDSRCSTYSSERSEKLSYVLAAHRTVQTADCSSAGSLSPRRSLSVSNSEDPELLVLTHDSHVVIG